MIAPGRPLEERWENGPYASIDVAWGYLKEVMESLRPYLPRPLLPLRCRKHGHRWKEVPSFFPDDMRFEACVRCARAGLIITRTSSYKREAV